MTAKRRHNGHNGHDVQARFESLRSDFEALQADMRGLMKEVGDEANERVSGAVGDATRYARETTDRIEDWGVENLDTVRNAVRNQPLASCVLSMSAGALIGALLLRR